ncbi:hypothetical protein QEH38_gp74 [Mycobacterium phage LilSpotty]|uniref:Uncharacterized protein n=1 Tax=Mycobacterium phage LilSpotty TaxID=2588512 RepID=A0A4Y6EM81_9CAUD|nr:hypothetical protein QEH38_gp74 [Mycobacterium phage LilSpotty]QDF19806.1 hypothetical protein SEA_LILSPOTTY_74 [Mycobacterium phage LilSpotty]
MSRYLRLFPNDPDRTRVFPTPVEPGSADAGVAWKLIHAPGLLTRGDRLYAASIMEAYAYLIYMRAKDRQSVVSEIRRIVAEES